MIPELHGNLDKIRDERSSTLGRVLNNAEFKKRLGGATNDGQFITRFPASVLHELVRKLANDFAHHVSVSKVKSKEQQVEYIDELPAPDEKNALPAPAPLDSTPVTNSGGRRGGGGKPKPKRPDKLLKDLDVNKLSGRTASIVTEVRALDPEKMPNTAAM